MVILRLLGGGEE